MQPIRWAVIGVGRFGKVHCQALESLPQAHLTAICTRNPRHLREATELVAVERRESDWRRLIEDDSIQAVSITTHWLEHYEIAKAALLAGKHVLLEKPMAATSQQCDDLVEVAGRSAGHLMVGHVCRFDPRCALAKQAIDEGQIGRVVSLHAKRNLPRAPGHIRLDKISPLMGDGIHDADLMMWFLGAQPHTVYARNVRAFDYTYPDVGWAMLHFGAGKEEAIGVVETNWCLPENVPTVIDARLEVVGTDGKLTVDCSHTGLSVLTPAGEKNRDTVYWPQVHGRPFGVLRSEIEYFADCLLGDRTPEVITPIESANAVRVMECAEQSAEAGKPVGC